MSPWMETVVYLSSGICVIRGHLCRCWTVKALCCNPVKVADEWLKITVPYRITPLNGTAESILRYSIALNHSNKMNFHFIHHFDFKLDSSPIVFCKLDLPLYFSKFYIYWGVLFVFYAQGESKALCSVLNNIVLIKIKWLVLITANRNAVCMKQMTERFQITSKHWSWLYH